MKATRRRLPAGVAMRAWWFAGAALVLAGAGRVGAEWSGLLVPAYFSPGSGTGWSQLAEAAAQAPLTAIANEANGPGATASTAARQAFARVRANGGRVIGYVYSSYGKRAAADVIADIDRWAALYPLDGIFVDEMSNDGTAASVAYYRGLLEHVQSSHPGWLVMGNPGTTTREVYLSTPAVDQVVTFEHHSGYPGYVPDAWARKYPAQSFAHLGYQVTNLVTAAQYFQLSRQRRAGWVYFTDDALPNPWDRLPSYWADEVAFVREANREESLQISLGPGEAGTVSLTISSIPGRHVIENSADLVHWSEFHALGTSTGRASLMLATGGGATSYFRVRR